MKPLNITFSLLFFTTFLFAQNINHPNIQAPFGLEINSFNGNLFYQRTDVFIPGQGLSLEVTFSYNSVQRSENRGVGNGWLFNYHSCYQILPDQSVVIDRMDGRRDTFQFDSGNYLPPMGIFDALSEYAPNQFKLVTKFGMEYYFDQASHRQLTKIEDRNGNSLTLSYIGSKLNAATDPTGRGLAFQWTGDRLTSVTDVNTNPQRIYQYAYDGVGNLIKYTNPIGEVMHYAYDANGNLISMVDGNGNEVLISYDGQGAVRRVFSCLTSVNVSYNAARRQTFVIEENGSNAQTTTYTFDENGNLTNRQGTCCGFNVSFEYDADGNLTKRTDANDNVMQFTFDSFGNRLTEKDALNQTTTYTYEPNFNQLASITDPKGNTSIYSYDGDGNLTQIARPMGITESFTYDANGNLLSTTDGNGNLTSYTYNAHGYLTNITYPIGSESYAYDGVGNLTTVTDANSNTLTFTYDPLNRPATITDHLGNARSFSYDTNGNLLSETDENNNQQQYAYDILNRLFQVTTPVATYEYDYDPVGNLTRVLDGNLHATQYEYNVQNLPTSETDGAGNATFYQYDNAGNLVIKTDANGKATTYTYNALNRLIEKSYEGNTDQFSYDANGNLASASNNDITINYTYDDLNRLTQKTYVEWNKSIQYTYDHVGNRATMTDPDGGVTTYMYDDLNRLTTLTNPNNSITAFQYDAASRLSQQNHGNGTRTEYTYNSADHLLSITHLTSSDSIFSSFSYTYDAKGNRLSMTDQNGGVTTYTYDIADRLTAVNYADGQTETFTYDATGNRTQLLQNGAPTAYTYDAADRLESAGTASYTFDENGNLLNKIDNQGTTYYTYDGEDRLLQVNRANGTTIEYLYDPFGNRLQKSVDGTPAKFVLDGVNILMELDDMNASQAKYTSGFGYDTWFSLERGGSEYFYHADALGSIFGISDGSENVVKSYDYFAFGSLKNEVGNLENSLTYTGREWDAEAGLFYYRARYYLSGVGRFLTKDKFRGEQENPRTLHRYVYVLNNPITYLDNSGFNTEGIRGDLTALFATISIGNFFDDEDRCIVAFTFGLGFSPGVSLTVGTQTTNANNVNDLLGNGTSKGATFGTQVGLVGLSGEYNKLTGFNDNFNETFSGDDFGGGVGYSILPFKVLPQGFGTNTIKLFNCSPESGAQDDTNPNSPNSKGCVVTVNSLDPNEIKAPAGVGAERWVAKDATLHYTIFFENDPDSATAAAQFVQILQTLDTDLDPQTFQLTSFGFGSFEFEILPNSTHYEDRLDVADSVGVLVDVKAGINFNTNQLIWEFESIDTLTGFFTSDPFAGFLPINDSTGIGEGFVSYLIQPKETAVTFDSIHAQADIIFDTNDPLATNIEVNLIDADAPATTVLPILAAIDSSHLIVEWMGSDIGAGVESYTLYVSHGGGPFLEWLEDTSLLSAIYQGALDSNYCFISVGRDSVSNLEDFPDSCITFVAFTADLLNNCPNLADLVLNHVPIQTGTYRSSNTINSSASIATGTDVSMLAEQSVALNPDFYVLPGAVFYAAIAPCANGNFQAGGGQFQLTFDKSSKTIEFALPEAADIMIYVEDLKGKRIATLMEKTALSKGQHQIKLEEESILPPSFYIFIQSTLATEQIWMTK